MKKLLFIQIAFIYSIHIYSQVEANPFSKYGYDVLTATSSHGEFEEFHDLSDIVQIGSVLFNSATKEIVGFTDQEINGEDIPSAISAMSIDPYCEKYYSISPYAYCLNNPIKYVDPTGMLVNPIYDEQGSFLGTDDRGLQGKAIVMNKKDFTQSMKHDDAMSKNLGTAGLKDGGLDKLTAHYNHLPYRPDYDGKLTLSEANTWYAHGNGEPLFVDGAQISLSPLKNGDLPVGETTYINFASPQNANFETGLVYGTIAVTPLDGVGNVRLGGTNAKLDTYDFDHQPGRTGRNVATAIGKAWADFSTFKTTGNKPFDIYVYGTGKLK